MNFHNNSFNNSNQRSFSNDQQPEQQLNFQVSAQPNYLFNSFIPESTMNDQELPNIDNIMLETIESLADSRFQPNDLIDLIDVVIIYFLLSLILLRILKILILKVISNNMQPTQENVQNPPILEVNQPYMQFDVVIYLCLIHLISKKLTFFFYFKNPANIINGLNNDEPEVQIQPRDNLFVRSSFFNQKDKAKRNEFEEKLNLINKTKLNEFLLREARNKETVKQALTRFIVDLGRFSFINFDSNNLNQYL